MQIQLIRHDVTNKIRTTKTYTRTTITNYLEARTWENVLWVKHVLWTPNTQASLDNSWHANNEYNANTHYT